MKVKMESTFINTQVPNLNDEWLYYLSPRFLTFRPKQNIFFQTEKYTLKTADTLSELIELFRLRHFIFLNEGNNENILDVDQYDSECDHILIKCNKTNQICGTYRIITKNDHVGFYSESEFFLNSFLETFGTKMELGRACIHPFHRNGHVIDLLWKGIGAYATKINANYLFGCSSVEVMSNSKVISLLKYLERNKSLSTQFAIAPKGKYTINFDNINFCELFDDDHLKKAIPPLLSSYINAGAKVYGSPAFDLEFDCLDFFTILDLNNINPTYKKRYFKND
jgi:putative hemolysin